MARTLYLIEARAKSDYTCPACRQPIARGALHFRHDPYPYSRAYRGHKTSHWCCDCISASAPGPKDWITGRLHVPAVAVISRSMAETAHPPFEPLRVELVGIGRVLAEQVDIDPVLVHSLNPQQFEEFICDRFSAIGFESKLTGATNRKDGGIDILFWPRQSVPFPFLGAAQLKHRRDPSRKEGVSTVRDFAGAISGHPFSAGVLITNTSFTPDVEWFARERAKLIRLRGFSDVRRWVMGSFIDEAEWREIPTEIELCPGVTVRLRGG